MSFAAFAVTGTALRSLQARFAFATPCNRTVSRYTALAEYMHSPELRSVVVANDTCQLG